MMMFLAISQFCISLVMGLYFLVMLRNQFSGRTSMDKESVRELERLKRLNGIKLTTPLTEKTRPRSVNEIVGQEEGIKALRGALCGENPQHVLIYGPPGVGKTAASRVVLDEARKNPRSPFREGAPFVEVDATTMQYDERSIADPLVGSVHDPIYQGAGAYGPAGVPIPKEGAVTKAHGGVLFVDEIGEFSPLQMNKLLKVLEDRRVFFDSAYYSRDNKEIPKHIHEIFRNGIPADFRLIGATTRLPEEIPPALRSRCVEIYFKNLSREDVKKIARDAAKKTNMEFAEEVFDYVATFADNGRDAVNIVQTAESIARLEKKSTVEKSDVEWVVETGKYSPRFEKAIDKRNQIGRVSGIAVYGGGQGCILDIEAVIQECDKGQGQVFVTGAVEEEEISNNRQKLRRKSSIMSSVRNVLTVLNQKMGIHVKDMDIHINFPNCVPVDGPSAGIAIFSAVYSAIKGIAFEGCIAMTGEISINGDVCGVGEVPLKIRAAIEAGAEKIIIPKANKQQRFETLDAKIIAIDNVFQLLDILKGKDMGEKDGFCGKISNNIGIISAEGVDIF